MPKSTQDKVVGLEEVSAELKQFQKTDHNGWITFGYKEGTKNEVIKTNQGTDFESLKALFVDNDCVYAYLRYEHKVEISTTVKFAFVDWTPNSLPPMRKALLSTHKGQIGDVMKPAHVTFQWSVAREIDEQSILDKIGFASGTKDHVTTKQALAKEGGGIAMLGPTEKREKKSAPLVNEAVKENRTLQFVDENAIRDALKAVRADDNPIDWALVSYQEGGISALELVATGDSGLEGMLATLDENRIWYGLFRVTQQIDKTTAVKFGFFKLLFPTIKSLWKAQLSTHRGFIVDLFQPYHVEFLGDRPSDLSVEMIMDRIASTAGVKSNVVGTDKLDAENKRKADYEKRRVAHLAEGPQVNAEATTISFEDESAFHAAIKAVRSDADETTYMVAELDGKTLKMVGTGQGDPVEGVKGMFPAKAIAFALIRTTDKYDASTTVKFVYIKWKPDTIPPNVRSLFTTMKGAIDPLFEPYHTDLTAATASEITNEIVTNLVQAAAGTKNYVKAVPT